jgi:hypothetical protein
MGASQAAEVNHRAITRVSVHKSTTFHERSNDNEKDDNHEYI